MSCYLTNVLLDVFSFYLVILGDRISYLYQGWPQCGWCTSLLRLAQYVSKKIYYCSLKVKVKVTPEQATKVQRGRRDIAPLFL